MSYAKYPHLMFHTSQIHPTFLVITQYDLNHIKHVQFLVPRDHCCPNPARPSIGFCVPPWILPRSRCFPWGTKTMFSKRTSSMFSSFFSSDHLTNFAVAGFHVFVCFESTLIMVTHMVIFYLVLFLHRNLQILSVEGLSCPNYGHNFFEPHVFWRHKVTCFQVYYENISVVERKSSNK